MPDQTIKYQNIKYFKSVFILNNNDFDILFTRYSFHFPIILMNHVKDKDTAVMSVVFNWLMH